MHFECQRRLLCPRWRSPARFVDQRAEAVAGEADEYVVQGGFSVRVGRRVTLPDALAVPLAIGRAVIGQQFVEDQGFEVQGRLSAAWLMQRDSLVQR